MVGGGTVRDSPAETLEDLRRSERSLLIVRALALPWAMLQVATYTTQPYPKGVKGAGQVLVAVLAAAVVASLLANRRVTTLASARALAVFGLAADVLVVSAFAWLFAFDQESALWAVLLIIPLEGAIRFQLRGALATWAATTVLYVGREIWGSGRYGYRFQLDSITFRMGIGLLIALTAGLMARDLIRQRARLRQANDDLTRVDRIRSALVTTLAHDVRNPLTAIRGTFSLLIGRTDLGPRMNELVQATDRSAERLERLSINLLDLARLEQGRLELSAADVPLAPIVHAAAGFADPDDIVQIEIDPSLNVHADAERLEQSLVNLIANARRYGAPPVVVSAEQVPGFVQIDVADCGTGIPPDLEAHLFEPFRASAAKGSVGFGLTIVKALTEAQGGHVTYRDNVPTGSIFTIEIPAAAGPQAPTPRSNV